MIFRDRGAPDGLIYVSAARFVTTNQDSIRLQLNFSTGRAACFGYDGRRWVDEPTTYRLRPGVMITSCGNIDVSLFQPLGEYHGGLVRGSVWPRNCEVQVNQTQAVVDLNGAWSVTNVVMQNDNHELHIIASQNK